MLVRDLTMKMIGFFVNRFVQESSKEIEDGLTTSERLKSLLRQAVSESCVLLKNDGVLPLKGEKISVFGRGQFNSFYTGYGSGGDVKAPYRISINQGFKNANLKLNEQIDALYQEWTKKNVPYDGFWGFWPYSYPEMPISDDEIKRASKESDVAFIVIGRAAGEDRENKKTRGSWFLTKEEESLMSRVSAAFQRVCVILNVGSIIDLSWVERYHISSVLIVWLGGQELGNGVADVVSGKVSPSGKLPDTIAPVETYPSDPTFALKKFSEYREDIFVGYRYFETFEKESVFYPFGFGLSYSTFEIKAKLDEKLAVFVRNSGNFKAKMTVELYAKAPNGALGKAEKVLISYQKTRELAPNETQELTFSIRKDNLASYDDIGIVEKNAFVLEEGDYEFFVGEDVRNAKSVGTLHYEKEVLQKTYEACPPVKAFDRLVNRGRKSFEPVPLKSQNLKERIENWLPKSKKRTENLVFSDIINGKCTIEEFVASLSDEEIEALLRGSDVGMYDPNGVEGNAGIIGGTSEVLRKKGVPVLSTNDGMSGIRLQAHSSLIPIATALAATFNEELVYAIGGEIGREMRERNSQIILSPAVNIHRHPLGGRNFEYFSEDPYLSGRMASAYVKGVQSEGVSTTIKHFACNEQETARHINDSIVSERALREIYLKPFEICIKDSSPDCLMMSYNKLNGVNNCYQYDLATTILRKEWGYRGLVMTDWWMDYGSSPDYKGLELQAYRVKAQIDVFMPGCAKFGKYKGKSDGSLLRAFKDGTLSRAEAEQSASNVIRLCQKYTQK